MKGSIKSWINKKFLITAFAIGSLFAIQNTAAADNPDPASVYPIKSQIDSVSATNQSLTVEGFLKVHVKLRGKPLQLFELQPYQPAEDYMTMTPIAVINEPLVGARFSFQIDRYDQSRDRLYSKFLIVVPDSRSTLGNDESLMFHGNDLLIDNPQYVTGFHISAVNEWLPEDVVSKKGIYDDGLRDSAEELGVAHGKISVVLNKLLYKDASVAPMDAVMFPFEGEDYYIRKPYLDQLDSSIRTLTRNGSTVLLAMLIQELPNDPTTAAIHMIHPHAEMGEAGVSLPGWNMTDETGTRYFKAAFEFLFSRYMRDDQEFGRVTGIKVGNEVNAQWTWHNSGEMTMEAFMQEYERAVRMVYTAARKYTEEPKVYISLTHYWSEIAPGSTLLRNYPPRDVIETMNTLSKMQGDFP